jgi:hypothetical protein
VILYAYRVLVLCIKYLWRTLKRNKGGNKGNRIGEGRKTRRKEGGVLDKGNCVELKFIKYYK